MPITAPSSVELAPQVSTVYSAPGAIPGGSAAATITDSTGSITVVPAVFTADTVTLTAPDGAVSGTLTLTNGDNLSTATNMANVSSQYLDASGFTGYGSNTLTNSDINAILRQASGYVDALSSQGTFRYLSTVETHKWRSSRRVYPRRRPIVAVTAFKYQINATQFTSFANTDMIIAPDLNYIEILNWAIGTYALIGAIETLGYAADIVQLTYTAGYKWGQYPPVLREATALVARKMLAERQVADAGLAGFSSIKSGMSSFTLSAGNDDISKRVVDMLRSLESPARFA